MISYSNRKLKREDDIEEKFLYNSSPYSFIRNDN